MAEIVIRLATAADLAGIQELNQELFKHDSQWISHLDHDWPYGEGEQFFKTAIAQEDAVCYVAEAGEQLVGYITGSIKPAESYRKLRRAELDNMLIKSDYRHLGIGKRLAGKLIAWSRQHGAQKILVTTSVPNQDATAFYQALGFEPYSLELELDLESRA